MEIKAADVMKLRKMTGAGMMDCKKALAEAEGDFARAPIQITGHHELSVGRIRGNNVAGITILAFKVYCKELVSCQ